MTRYIFTFFFALCLTAGAANNVYQNASGDGLWGTAENWSLGTVPAESDNAVVNNGRRVLLSADAPDVDMLTIGNNPVSNTLLTVSANLAVKQMRISWAATALGAVRQVDGLLRVTEDFRIASTSAGAGYAGYEISGGALDFSGIRISAGTGGPADFVVNGHGPDYVRGGDMTVGAQGTMTFRLGALGVSPVELDGSLTFDAGARLIVDGSLYDALDGYFPLVKTGDGVPPDLANAVVSFVGLDGRFPALVAENNGVWLRLLPPPSFSDALCSIVPPSSVRADYSNSAFSISRELEPSGSAWGLSLHEAHVMDVRLKHDELGGGANTMNRSWDMRIGRGGHIYSLRTPALGETVPPQTQNPINSAPWIDEVWQAVAVDPTLNDPPYSRYFIHQAGVYFLRDPALEKPFYSPQVASALDSETRSFTGVYWGQHAHIDVYTDNNVANDWQSHLLIYSRFRDLGQGLIEVSTGLYNFGSDTPAHLNLPWGGVRRTSTRYAFEGATNSPAWNILPFVDFGDGSARNFNDTGGWFAFCDFSQGSTPALGVVYGLDAQQWLPGQHNKSYVRWGTAGGKYVNNETSWRNYLVMSVIRRYRVYPGEGVWSRYYFVLGDNVSDVANRVAERSLVAAELKAFNYDEASSPLIGYRYTGSGNEFRIAESQVYADFFLYAHPLRGSVPVFEIIEGDGTRYLTWNPYVTGIKKTYDGSVAGIRLLGFALREADANPVYPDFQYRNLAGIMERSPQNYLPGEHSLLVRARSHYGEWALANGLDVMNVNTAATLNTVSTGVRLRRDDVGFKKGPLGAWTVSEGVLQNAGTNRSTSAEGAIGHMVDLASLESSDRGQLTLSFDYSMNDPLENLFVHLWGYVNDNSEPTTHTMNLEAYGGSAWESSAGAMTAYNLGKPNGVFTWPAGVAFDAASILQGPAMLQTYSNTFDLTAFEGAPNAVSDYDYLVLGFARRIGESIAPLLSIRNISLLLDGGETLFSFMQEPPATGVFSDPDRDGYNNLSEYALGLNPVDANVADKLPEIKLGPGLASEYVYRRRRDAAQRGLKYVPEASTNLQFQVWSTNGIRETGVGILDAEIELVTNRVDVSSPAFLRLRLEL